MILKALDGKPPVQWPDPPTHQMDSEAQATDQVPSLLTPSNLFIIITIYYNKEIIP